MGKTCLVTGGCGFVGRHLTQRLIARGDSVYIIDDLSVGKPLSEWLSPHQASKVKFLEGDLIRVLPASTLPRFDEVFHLASVVGGRAVIEGDPMAVAIDLAIDAVFFRWVVANRDKIGRVLYASSSAAYPIDLQQKQAARALREDDIHFAGNLGMPDMTYGWSKLTGEYLARIAAARYGVHVACVRPFSGYGGDQDQAYPVPAIARRAARREDPLVVWGSGTQGRDFVHIDDCIEAILRTLNVISDGGAVNIGSGVLTTFREVAMLLAEVVGYTPRIQSLNDKPVGVAARYSDPTYMRQVLGWQPVISLRDGLARVLQAQREVLEVEVRV